MKYNKKNIGERIRECRKAYRDDRDYRDHAPDQAGFGALLFEDSEKEVHPNTISSWENGKTLPELKYLLRMCDLFDCELGYLLCEYDTKTRAATDIQKETGLSADSIKILQKTTKHFADSFEAYEIEDKDMYHVGKLHLIDAFIKGCEPINSDLETLLFDQLMTDHILDSHANHESAKRYRQNLLNTFDQIFHSDLQDYDKVNKYIDTLIETNGYAGTDEESIMRNLYYMEYQLLENQRTHNKTNGLRNSMMLTFNQIIDSIIEWNNNYRKEQENGEHEKK